MSTLEKFGILVILILVVIIGVVAVWGVGGNDGANPFEAGGGVATEPAPSGTLPDWPASGAPAAPAVQAGPPAPVPPPAVAAPVTPPSAPAVARAPSPEPAADEGTTYEVRKSDTLAKIAAATLGSSAKWPLLVDANPGLDPKRLKIGMRLRIPTGGVVAQAPPAPRPPVHSLVAGPNPADGPTGVEPVEAPSAAGREVEVQEGDTFWTIAQRELGDGAKYTRIVKENPGIDPRKLRKGMRIRLPAAE